METSSPVMIMTLPQVIDAALGGPQLGIVSYVLLNNILQVLCQQLHLEDLQLQYHGTIAEQLKRLWDPQLKTEVPSVGRREKKKSSEGSSSESGSDDKTVALPASHTEKHATMTVVVPQSTIDNMMKDIHHLKGEVAELRALPSNNDIFNAVKNKNGQPTPIGDMYQMLTITKRVDATEQAITKVATFVEDLTKYIQGDNQAFREVHESYDFQRATPQYAERRMHREDSFDDYFTISPTDDTEWDPTTTDRGTPYSVGGESAESFHGGSIQAADALATGVPSEGEPGASASVTGGAAPGGPATGGPAIKIPPGSIDISLASKLFDQSGSKRTGEEGLAQEALVEQKLLQRKLFAIPKSKMNEVEICDMPARDAFKLLQTEMKNLKRTTDELAQNALRSHSDVGGARAQQRQYKILAELEKKIGKCVAQINGMDNSFAVSYSGITNRLADLEESMKLVYDKAINEVQRVDFEEQLSQTVYSLNEKVRGLEAGMNKLTDSIEQAVEEAENDQTKIISLLDDLETLKSEKIGRKEFGEALAEKVDLCMVNRKVSHDQFNATCDDLSKGIEEALEKLMEQEELWHVALKEIQDEISGKLCRADLQPLENFVSGKLKILQQKMKTLAKLKKDQEAAATKRKFLRDVQCISCDKDVVMRTNLDPSVHLPGPPVMPAHKNIAPYLAYELDQLRKQQHQSQFGKNMHHFEAAMQENKGGINRYCGGQHTITTPQQRVSRTGNFLDQWGPKATQADDNGSNSKLGNNTSDTQKKSMRMPLTVRSAIKSVRPEKDKEWRSSASEGRRSP
ncbi:hypothetical protein WA026_019234 [Henosepilachna vigintioctopunctata]|uniref:DUF4795 domain-containing protein n=1 Tax=Henosepilachna vigintioctopunctata TaxID=420089 RepID=A0AAW1UU44_9CUCU